MSPEKSGGCVSSPLMMRTAAGEGHTDVDTARTVKQEEEALKSIRSATTTPPLRPAPRSAADGGPGSRPTLASRTRTAHTHSSTCVCSGCQACVRCHRISNISETAPHHKRRCDSRKCAGEADFLPPAPFSGSAGFHGPVSPL